MIMQNYQQPPVVKIFVHVTHLVQPYLLQHIDNTRVSVISSKTLIDGCENIVDCFKQYDVTGCIKHGCWWYISS